MPKQSKVIPIVQVPHITSGSHSRLSVFEQCKWHANLKFAQRIPEPERALRPGQTEHANDRGTRIHNNAELYVKGMAKLDSALLSFREEYDRLAELYKSGQVEMEGEWGMNREWETTDWKEAWLRLKLDVLVHASETHAIVIDLKTGRRDGNEVKHGEQVQLYQLVTFLRYPHLEEIDVELWYPDKDFLYRQHYRRDQGLRFLRKWNDRLTMMTNYEFKGEKEDANPNKFSCQWCMYGKKGNGVCTRGL